MNIKEHIEAGHYQTTDDKGRPLVPIGCNRSATICATDAPGQKPILGFIDGCGDVGMTCSYVLWDEHGNNTPSQPRACWVDILPPPPRKVKVRQWCWAEKHPRTGITHSFHAKADAERHRLAFVNPEHWVLVELTGEYEEPWP